MGSGAVRAAGGGDGAGGDDHRPVDRLPQPSLQRPSAAAAIGEALRNRRFVVLCGTHFVCGLQLIFINTHLPNYLALCGQDPMLGATALAIIGGINIAGCLLAGWLGQRYLKNVLLGLTYLGRSVVLMIYFLLPPTPATTILFAAAMGMMWLGVIPLVSGYVADLFGTRNMATLLGVSFVVHQMGSVIGAWGGGMIFDMFGNYDLAWRFGVSIGIVAGIVQIVFGGPSGTWSAHGPCRGAELSPQPIVRFGRTPWTSPAKLRSSPAPPRASASASPPHSPKPAPMW